MKFTWNAGLYSLFIKNILEVISCPHISFTVSVYQKGYLLRPSQASSISLMRSTNLSDVPQTMANVEVRYKLCGIHVSMMTQASYI